MPALIAHHLLGLDVLAELRAAPPNPTTPLDPAKPLSSTAPLDPAKQQNQTAPLDPMAPPNISLPLDPAVEAAFLLGCQGPDPFFYTVFHRELVKIRRFGSRMHQERVAESLDSLRMLSTKLPPTIQPLLTAYIRGWLCHFTLDSQAHPYVYFLVQEFCSAGIPGLDENAAVEVHSQIESDLDSSLLYRHNNQTINTFRPMDEILLCDKHTVYWISVLYRLVAARVFAVRLPGIAFIRAVKDMRTSYKVLYSPQGYKRELIGRIERLARTHSLAQATAHRSDVGEWSDFDNQDHQQWTNPYSGEANCSSFADIYADAVALAVQRQLLYSEDIPAFDLVGALNFSGSPVQ